jgi:hypothetical protein
MSADEYLRRGRLVPLDLERVAAFLRGPEARRDDRDAVGTSTT